jgi:SAM-dependent methyltransferase
MSDRDPSVDQLYHDPALAQFYDFANQWSADLDYCQDLADDAKSVLDLGCGTGRFAASLTDGRMVFGVEPAAAMLDIARQRPGGGSATWVEGDARRVRLGKRIDLVVLTGHAFQVFLTEDDQQAVLVTIAEHLATGGRFIFDTRNPAKQEWHQWTETSAVEQFEHPDYGTVETWGGADRDAATGIVTYRTNYRVVATGQLVSASSMIQFPAREAVAAMMEPAGLSVDRWLGDWQDTAFEPTSPDIIPLGRLL